MVTRIKKLRQQKTSAIDREKAKFGLNGMTEYKIGHTTYLVRTIFNPVSQDSLSDMLKRLIIRESEKLLGESRP
jgi:hypothetical protein